MSTPTTDFKLLRRRRPTLRYIMLQHAKWYAFKPTLAGAVYPEILNNYYSGRTNNNGLK